jgi:hypothetical protein
MPVLFQRDALHCVHVTDGVCQCQEVFLLFDRLDILVIRSVCCRYLLRHIRVPLGSVFCLHKNVYLDLLRLSCFLFGFHLLGGGGLHRFGCHICGVQLAGSSSELGRMRSGELIGVFLVRITVRNCRLVGSLAIPNILRG